MLQSVVSKVRRLLCFLSKLRASQSIESLLNAKERALGVPSLTSDCDVCFSFFYHSCRYHPGKCEGLMEQLRLIIHQSNYVTFDLIKLEMFSLLNSS
jgi:hypothetical protein